MIRLVLAELHRLRSRRLTWIACVLLVLALGGLQVALYQSVQPLSQSEISQAQAEYQQAKQEYDQGRGEAKAGEQQCIQEGGEPEECNSEPQPDWYVLREPIAFSEIAPYIVSTAFYFTAFALALVAASSIGAEFTTGALANWLTFVPSRSKVLTAKLVAVVLGSAVVAGVALLATVGSAITLSRWSGAAVSGTAQLWGQGVRGAGLVVVLAVLAFAVALLTRHTVGAVGALVAVFLLSVVLTSMVELDIGLGWLKPLLPQNNISAFLNNGYSYAPGGSFTSLGSGEPPMLRITFPESLLYWLVVLAAAMALTFAVFRRRDVN